MIRHRGNDICRQFVGGRELGLSSKRPGMTDLLYKRLYSSFDDNLTYEDRHFVYTDYSGSNNSTGVGPTGAIFNLAFSPDGSILGAASERKSVLLFDPSSRKLINSVENAHTDSVNCIRFLDTRLFATCSDDTTVALWDARYLKTRLRTLSGHSNWVKNIEFSYRENCLVTSGFDGAIYLWDINKYSEREGLECTKAFYNNGLMRMKLTADGTKMVISTTNAYIMIIHDLNLETLAKDLQNFKPNVYRIMQISGEPMPSAFNFTHLFHAKRNRVEFISDFAPSNDAEVISSLQLHPQGWVAVSRNISSDEQSEWCCVHDIQSYPTSKDDDIYLDDRLNQAQARSASSIPTIRPPVVASVSQSATGFARLAAFFQASSTFQDAREEPQDSSRQSNSIRSSQSSPQRVSDDNRSSRSNVTLQQNVTVNPSFVRQLPDVNEGLPSDFATVMELFANYSRGRRHRIHGDEVPRRVVREETGEPPVVIEEAEQPNPDEPADGSVRGILLITPGSVPGGRPRLIHMGNRRRQTSSNTEIPRDARLHQNTARLTHFLEESNHCRGYIKEISFSPDGRVLASPFAHGIRLLAFDDQVRELSDCPPCYPSECPKMLHEVGLLTKCHNDAVLSTAFSPFHFTLASGCMAGKIVWHQPML